MNRLSISTGEPELVNLVREMNDGLADANTPFNEKLWSALSDAELHLVGIPTDAGGPGGSLLDLVATVFECARSAAAIPLVENWIAQFVRSKTGLGVRPGLSTCIGPVQVDRGAVSVDAVTWAPHADELLVLEHNESTVSARPVTAWDADRSATRSDLAGQPAHDVQVLPEHLDEPGSSALDFSELVAVTHLARAAQISGAIRGCFDLSRGYAAERHQFGVPINSFPAVQHHLIKLAQAAAISRVSTFRAAAAIERRSSPAQTAWSARLITNDFARVAIRCAHQVHGAIGMTREYRLASMTRRLHWWRLTDDGFGRHASVPAGDMRFLDNVWLETKEVAAR